MDISRFGTLPEWVHWVAQDADGTWWGYEVEPLLFHRGWYENELGDRIRLIQEKPGKNWQNTLFKVTGT